MRIFSEEFYVSTENRRDLKNITEKVEDIVVRSGIEEGFVLVFVPHATCALFANEDEPLIREDYINLFNRLVPENENYKHNRIDDNADSHLLSALFKQFFIFPIKDGKIVKGTWQELFLAEFDGPRARRVIVFVIGD
jgi:secondary thiamine-phosphate synthase enzyme